MFPIYVTQHLVNAQTYIPYSHITFSAHEVLNARQEQVLDSYIFPFEWQRQEAPELCSSTNHTINHAMVYLCNTQNSVKIGVYSWNTMSGNFVRFTEKVVGQVSVRWKYLIFKGHTISTVLMLTSFNWVDFQLRLFSVLGYLSSGVVRNELNISIFYVECCGVSLFLEIFGHVHFYWRYTVT